MHPTIIDDPRLLRERFLRARRTADGPVVAVGDSTFLVNGPAAVLARAADRAPLWEWARREVASRTEAPAPPPSGVVLASGARPGLCEGVWAGRALVGAVVRLTAPARPPRVPAPYRVRSLEWAELTRAQRLVAVHVARGLTNRQTAALLSVSPHTVDYHLRHVFQRLQIHSRVELARMVAEAASSTTRSPA
ncbi:helix-turn-helix transcriptional regulator [Streptomyces sp. NPDC005811]|uniref:helix-turn-helix transcriptional regulator n=1 Tax=Streptomyces sp. NPDC005811 TaxID=3154565 RepID=UPI00341188C7